MASKLQQARERREKIRKEIHQIQKEVTANRDNKDHKGHPMTNELRTKYEKLKPEYLEAKGIVEAEEASDEVDQFLVDEAERESRSRRGPGGKVDPDRTDTMPGGRETYGERFGNDRSAIRQHAQTEERRALAMQLWASAGRDDIPVTDEHRQAFAELKANNGNWRIRCFDTLELNECRSAIRNRKDDVADRAGEAVKRVREQRAVAGPGDRGNLAPQVTTEAFEKAGLMIGGIYNAAEVRVTPTGTKMTWPTANDTANEGGQIDETNAQPTASTDPAISSFSLGSYEFTSKFIRIGNVTLRDSPIALATEIGLMMGERLARGINRKATSGDGVDTLTGIESSAAMGREMATPTTYAWADLYYLKYSVDGTYRMNGAYMMNDEILVEMMILPDNDGRPMLIEPNDGSLPRLLNSPVITNNHMAGRAEGTNARPAMTYGDHSKYKLRLVGDVRTQRYLEKFAEFDQTGFDGKRGADGGLLNAGTNPVKKLAPAA